MLAERRHSAVQAVVGTHNDGIGLARKATKRPGNLVLGTDTVPAERSVLVPDKATGDQSVKRVDQLCVF